MDIYDETKVALKGIWDDANLRQQAKIVIVGAIGNATELSVRQAQDICDELDRMLLDEEEKPVIPTNKGL